MVQDASLGIAISFTAGVLSFLSPCVLPLIPSYVSFITGLSLDDVQRSRRIALVHSLLFVTGFTLVFLALGATATVLGRVLFQYRDWVGRIGGVVGRSLAKLAAARMIWRRARRCPSCATAVPRSNSNTSSGPSRSAANRIAAINS